MKEEWKDIQGYEGAYKVSNTGKIMSLNYHGSGKSKELISSKPKKGYPYVGLCKGGKVKSFKVHRLVAQAFIPNLYNKPCVNHKDGNKHNNNVDNLEWATVLENNLHMYHVLNKHPMKGYKFDKNNLSKPVSQFYISEEGYKYHIATYINIKAAALINNLCARSISYCCKGYDKYKHVGGYVWEYAKKTNTDRLKWQI